MAVYTVSNAGGNYNTGSTWVGGVVPSTTDSIAFSSTSGNLTINVSSTCSGVNFTNYTGTVTFSTSLISTGTINFGSGGYNVAGSNSLVVTTTTSITSNGTAWKGNFQIAGSSKTYTLNDDMVVNGTLTISPTTQATLSGFCLTAKGNVTHSTSGNLIGTTNFVLCDWEYRGICEGCSSSVSCDQKGNSRSRFGISIVIPVRTRGIDKSSNRSETWV